MKGRTAVAVTALALGAAFPERILAQAEGAIAGRVLDARSRLGLSEAQVLVDDRIRAIADTGGLYRVRGVRGGWHRISARHIGYRSVVQDSVFVRVGATATLDFSLETNPLELAPLVVTAPLDPVLDPTRHRNGAKDQRRGSAPAAGELAGGGTGPVGRKRGAELSGRQAGRGVVHSGRAWSKESA